MKSSILKHARKLRGIYFIDPEDKEFKETINNARKKLETSVAPPMPCKIMKNCASGASNKNKTKLACIQEAAMTDLGQAYLGQSYLGQAKPCVVVCVCVCVCVLCVVCCVWCVVCVVCCCLNPEP